MPRFRTPLWVTACSGQWLCLLVLLASTVPPVLAPLTAQERDPSAHDLLESFQAGQFERFQRELSQVQDFGRLRQQLERDGREWSPEIRASVLLEAANLAYQRNPKPSRSGPEAGLFEDACKTVRQLPRSSDFEALWHRAALSVLSAPYAVGFRVADHLGHLRGRYDDGHVALIRAMLPERIAWSEATQIQATLVDPAATDSRFEQRRRAGRARMNDALRALEAASQYDSYRAEATLRRGALLMIWEQPEDAVALLQTVERFTSDTWLRYMAELLSGRCFEALHRPTDARMSYRAAVTLRPNGKTAGIALAALEFSAGHREDANRLVVDALSSDGTDEDPWSQFPFGDYRFLDERVSALRGWFR